MFPNGCYSGNTPQWKFQLILKYSLHVYLDSLGKCQDFVRAVLHCVQPFVTPWTAACQAPLSLGFSRQAYRSGLPFPSPGDLPHLGIEPGYPTFQADALTSEPPGKPRRE